MNNFFIEIFDKKSQLDIEKNKKLEVFIGENICVLFDHKHFEFLNPKSSQNFAVLSSISSNDKNRLLTKYDESPQSSSSQILLNLFLKHGKNIFKDFKDKFFLFIYDTRNKNFYVIRDHVGFYNIYFTENNSSIYLSSRIKHITQFLNFDFKVSRNNLKKFLELKPIRDNETFYEHIFKTPPSSILKNVNKNLVIESYKKFKKISLNKSSNEQIQQLKQLLKDSIIKDSNLSEKKIGFLFSGGLDSSTIISFYRMFSNGVQSLYAYTSTYDYINPKIKYLIDERDYQKEIIKHKEVKDRSFDSKKLSTLSDLDWYLKIIGQPFFFPNLYVAKHSFELASYDGVKKIYNGNDGDTVISHGYEYLLELFLSLRWIKLYKSISKVAKIRNKSKFFVFKKTILKQISFNRKIFFSAKKKHEFILNQSIHSNAIEVQSLIAAEYGIEEFYPFYNIDLMSFCINVRPDLKLNGISRYILRKAIKGVVPDKIRKRTNKSNLGHALVETFVHKDREIIENYMNNPASLINQIYDNKYLKKQWKKLQKDPRKFSTGSNVPSLIFSYVVANRWLELNKAK